MRFFPTLYGSLISFASLIGYFIIRSRASLYKRAKEKIDDIFLVTMIASIVGARAYHVIDKWDLYRSNPVQILSIWNGGIGIYGALTGGLLALWVCARIYKISLFTLLDIITPAVALGQALGRIGNYFNSEGFGPPTNLPWKIFIPLEKRPEIYKSNQFFHPTFFYESVLCFLLAGALLGLSKRLKKKPGAIGALYLIGYGSIRAGTEAFRIDTAQLGVVRVAEIFSILFIAMGASILWRSTKSLDPVPN